MSHVITAADAPSGEPPAAEAEAATPEAIDRIRPRLRHDVVYADNGFGAFVRNTETGFLIRGKSAYRWLATLIPYLTGDLTVGQLCEGLAPDRRAVVTSMITTLVERGFVRDAADATPAALAEPVAERFRSQLSFIGHYADDAARRFATYRAAPVLVLGVGETARAVARGLLRNGSETVELRAPGVATPAVAEKTPDGVLLRSTGPALAGDRYEVLVVCADEIGPAVIAEACDRLRADGPAILPIMTVGDRVALGPVTRAGASPCWGCLMLRLQANLDPADMAPLWQSIATRRSFTAGLPSALVAQIVGGTAAFDVFRLLTGALVGESSGAVLVQDVQTLESDRERLLPHPECSTCHGDGPPSAAGPPSAEVAGPTVNPVDGPAEELHERLYALVRKHVGIVAEFTDHQLTQLPLKVARCRVGSWAGAPARELVSFDVETLLGARYAVLLQAVLSYVDQVGDLRRAVPVVEVPADLRVPAERLHLASGLSNRDEATLHLPATDLRTGAAAWVPAAAVFPATAANGAAAFEPTAAGVGAGSTLAEADERGLLTALAYRALRRAAAGGTVHALDPASLAGNDQLTFLVRAAGHVGVRFRLYRLPEAEPAFVVLAVAEGESGTVPRWSVGAALDLVAAAGQALCEVVGAAQLDMEGVPFTPDLMLADLDPRALRVAPPAALGPSTERSDLLAALDDQGLRALRVQTNTPDLALVGAVTTVRVLLAEAEPREA